jgi:hypothetical protein
MAVRSKKNEYHGVNAHLHSHFQVHGGWSSFHTNHISDLSRALNRLLPEGYLVDVEQSLQIKEIHPDSGEAISHPEPDITIYTTPSPKSEMGSQTPFATLTLPLLETVELTEDLYYSAVVIYKVLEDDTLGRPIARLEVLSPTNKFGSGYVLYREKRNIALKSGVRLIEIDYLHQTESPVKGLPSYPRKQPGAYPYVVTVSDPTPDLEQGTAMIYAFHVDEPIPTITIPLAESDRIDLDLNAVYQETFASLTAYSYRVDYEQLPERFETYSVEDQERIRARMVAVTGSF